MSNSLERRVQVHEEGHDRACYTFTRRSLALKYAEAYQFVNEAIAREKQIKGWGRKKKEALINGDHEALKRLARNNMKDEENGSVD